MLKNLKQTKKNPVFLDDDDDMDVDTMDFPLPEDPPVKAAPTTNTNTNTTNSRHASGSIAVAATPTGVQRLSPADYKDWVCVYPVYIDNSKSMTDGRKISKEKAVEKPHAYHMAIAAQSMGLPVVYEGKKHPRDWANPGRIKVQLKNKQQFFMNPHCTTRKQLYIRIASQLPAIQKANAVPKEMISPLTTLAEIEAASDQERKARGLPTLAEMGGDPGMGWMGGANASASASASASANPPSTPSTTKQKKQKVKYIRA
ncbi:signal recognition particle, SRP19 subunit [Spinellus fusiger]|nr:signal recognition particle, SRP19 subunit [Spinellus fusiger]